MAEIDYCREFIFKISAEGVRDGERTVFMGKCTGEEIIRCRDCKHQIKDFHEDKRRKDGGYYVYGCELADDYSHVCLDDDFCSYAERTEE